MHVPAEDETLHAPGAQRWWNESFYANFFDARGTWGGFVRVGLSPNNRFADGGVYLFLPDGRLGVVRAVERRQGHAEPISAGRIRWERVEPLRRWRIDAEGDLFHFADGKELLAEQRGLAEHLRRSFRLALELEGVHEPFDPYPAQKSRLPLDGLRGLLTETRGMPARMAALGDQLQRASRLVGARHYEQACRVRGTLVLDGREHALDGAGIRDHSWGVREWEAFTRYRWLNGCLGPGFSFSLTRLQIVGFRFTTGFVCRDGRCVRVKSWKLGGGGREVRAEVRTEDGETHVITGDVERELPISIGGAGYLTEITTRMTRYRWRDLSGYGVAEFLEQLVP